MIRFLLFHLMILILFSSCLSANKNNHSAEKISSPPNILFILTDDQGWGDLGVFFQNERGEQGEHPWMKTPHLDRMADEGVILTNHYSNAPVCAPSRASFLLGVHQGHSNVRDNQFDKRLENNYTVANVLKEKSYATVAVGKWGLQGDTLWSEDGDTWPGHPLNRGFDEFYGYIRHRDGHEHYPVEGPYRGPQEVYHNHEEVSQGLDKCYTGDLWTAFAKKWITDHQKNNKDQPFFMYLAYDTPHATIELPTQAYPEGSGLNGGVQWIGEPEHMINTASGEIDSWTHPDYANRTWDHDGDPATEEVPWPDTYTRFATVIRRIDDAVGDIRQLLQDLKIDDNTFVVFTTDNGPSAESYLSAEYAVFTPEFFQSYGPFDGIKRDVWEGGIRVPAIATWPEHLPAGEENHAPAMLSDWLATFCDAAGLPIPERSDGESLLPVMKNEAEPEKPVYVEYFQGGRTPEYADFIPERQGRIRGQMQMIRLENKVGVRYDIQSAEDDFEIYDVMQDPQQKNDIGQTDENRELQKIMKERVLQMRRPDPNAPRPYDEAFVPSSPAHPEELEPGWKMSLYHTPSRWIPQVHALTPMAEKIIHQVKNPDSESGNMIEFSGIVRVPSSREYSLQIRTKHQTIIRIHDALLIDGDFASSDTDVKKGSIRLAAGMHPIRILIKKEENQEWDFDIVTGGAGDILSPLPEAVLFHQPKR